MPGSTRTSRAGRVALVAGLSAVLAAASVTTAAAATSGVPAASTAAPAAAGLKAGNYIVMLRDLPVSSYDGRIRGLAATKPPVGKRLDATSRAAQAYARFLSQRQDTVLRSAGVTARSRYQFAVNGFAARLTAAQAAKLSRDPKVLRVAPDRLLKPDTTETPQLLGLSGRTGLWAKLGGQSRAGRGVVVGVLDTGIWPENPAFRGSPVNTIIPQPVGVPYRTQTGRYAMKKTDGGTFFGVCQTGVQFTAANCNSKIVGARYFATGYLAGGNPADVLAEDEYLSPRDGDSHGSHTASTAAGNPVANVRMNGANFGNASGMAPAAKLSIYKVCWSGKTVPDGCATSDSVSAIDAAVADGVDVINFSIGGGAPTDLADPVGFAFLNAAAAGVFVSTSAGNAGPGPNTLDHIEPWLTTVAATTAHRFEGTVLLGNGRKYRGASVNRTAVPSTPLVLSTAAAAAGDAGAQARLCAPNSLDPAKVTGKIVVCDRGVVDRVAKSAEVKRAGGVGMILVNTAPGSLDPDVHVIPTVHLDEVAGAAVKAYVASTPNPTAALQVGDTTGLPRTPIPQVAGFSSRGPIGALNSDILKPDIAAPGVGIIAAVRPQESGPTESHRPLSGTSMAAPHIAGLAALILQANPLWSPARVKSAMMTTATDTVRSNGRAATDPFAQGAGFVNPRRFLDPGLVYDAGLPDYYSWLEGQGYDTGSGLRPTRTIDLNQASVSVGAMPGTVTVKRTVTALKPGSYRADVSLGRIGAVVTPRTLVFTRAGQSKSFTIRFTARTAPLEKFTTGFLTWTGPRGLKVRSPLAVRPTAAAALKEVHGTGASGSASYRVQLGTSPLPLSVKGLTPGTSTPSTVAVGPLTTPPTANASNVISTFTVPAGTTLARIETLNSTAGDDIDLFVYNAAGQLVAQASGSTARERVDLLSPAAGTYTVQVNGFAAAAAGNVSYTLRTFAVGNTAAGNLTATPSTLMGGVGARITVTLRWTGLDASRPYLGWVGYGSSPVKTIVSIN